MHALSRIHVLVLGCLVVILSAGPAWAAEPIRPTRHDPFAGYGSSLTTRGGAGQSLTTERLSRSSRATAEAMAHSRRSATEVLQSNRTVVTDRPVQPIRPHERHISRDLTPRVGADTGRGSRDLLGAETLRLHRSEPGVTSAHSLTTPSATLDLYDRHRALRDPDTRFGYSSGGFTHHDGWPHHWRHRPVWRGHRHHGHYRPGTIYRPHPIHGPTVIHRYPVYSPPVIIVERPYRYHHRHQHHHLPRSGFWFRLDF